MNTLITSNTGLPNLVFFGSEDEKEKTVCTFCIVCTKCINCIVCIICILCIVYFLCGSTMTASLTRSEPFP